MLCGRCVPPSWRWYHLVLFEHWYPPTRLYSVTSQKTNRSTQGVTCKLHIWEMSCSYGFSKGFVSKQIPWWYLKLGQNCFLRHPFQAVIHLVTHITQCYAIWGKESAIKYTKGLHRILIFPSWKHCVSSYIISVNCIVILSFWLPLHPQSDYVNLLSLIVKLSSVQFVCSHITVSESILKTSFQYLPKQRMRMYTILVPANARKCIERSFYTH